MGHGVLTSISRYLWRRRDSHEIGLKEGCLHSAGPSVASFKSQDDKRESFSFDNVPLLVEIKSQAGKDEGKERHEDGNCNRAAVGGPVDLGVGDAHVLPRAQACKAGRRRIQPNGKGLGTLPVWMMSADIADAAQLKHTTRG